MNVGHLSVPRHQFAYPISRVPFGDLRGRVAQIDFRVHPVELRRLHDSVNRRGAISAGIRSGKQ